MSRTAISASAILVPLLLLTPLVLLQGCASKPKNIISPDSKPLLYDQGSRDSLLRALDHQLNYVMGRKGDEPIELGGSPYDSARLAESLRTFKEILNRRLSPLALDRVLHENFTLYQAGGRHGRPSGEMLLTGYFEPLLQGSLEKSPTYQYPLYAPPADLVERSSADGKKAIWRLESNGSLSPYWTREEIDESDILAGNELVFLESRFDAFLLHVQGSGKIQLPDGSVRSIQYRTNNGHPYSSIGKLLVDTGIMPLEQVDIPAIRTYLRENSSEMDRILYHNRRYIFFGWGNGDEHSWPVGSSGEMLTPGRSIAIDGSTLPMGTIGYLVSKKPVIDANGSIIRWIPLQRFVFPQDTGAAIRGAGRADFFWGRGQYAETAAGAMKEKGKLYFLIQNGRKKEEPNH